jgi:outer membrane protein TolC
MVVLRSWRIARYAVPVALLCASAPGLAQQRLHTLVDGYVQDALSSNLALQQRDISIRQAAAALDEARAAWRPQLTLSARYSRAEGGRELLFPVGDLLNPVYRSLNAQLITQGQPPAFADIDNQVIELQRSREQDTRLSVSQVLYAPAIEHSIEARLANVDAQAAAREIYARGLIRDVRRAYFDWRRARSEREIVASSAELLGENLRVNSSLFDNGKITRDQVLRAEAELLAVQQQQREADNQIDLARSYLNYLRNTELQTPLDASPSASFEVHAVPSLGAVRELARRQRPETAQAQAAQRIAQANSDGERAALRPTLGLGLDAGIQGENYGFGGGKNFAVASLVLEWKVFDGGARRARISQASLAAEQAAVREADVLNLIDLDVQRARDSLMTAADSMITAQARFEAAEAGFQIASRKRDAGSISQVEFLDARSTLTGAELNRNLTRFEWLSRNADLAFASATEPLAQLAAERAELP